MFTSKDTDRAGNIKFHVHTEWRVEKGGGGGVDTSNINVLN